jgi:drug/metabolite transporter (DMT)-like permease
VPADAAARRDRLVGWACGAGLLCIWVSFHLMSRLTVRQALTPWDVAALRFGGAFLVALPLLAWFGLPRIPPRRWPAIIVFAGLCFPLCAYAGYQLAPAAQGSTVMAAGLPVAAALLSVAMGQGRIGPWRAASLAIVAGGCLLLGRADAGGGQAAWTATPLFLTAVTGWAVYTLLVQRWRLRAIEATLTVALLTGPLYLPVWYLALPSNIAQASWQVIVTQAAFHGGGSVILAGFFYTRCVALLGPGPTTMIGAAVPALATLLAWPLLGEALSPAALLAVGVVCAGLALAVLRPDRAG